jgi:ribosomal-protein-alanine N-acetyltransferase
MEESIRFVTEPVETARLVLSQPGAVSCEALHAFFTENKGFLAPWEPLRDPTFYHIESLTALLARQQRENLEGKALHLYLQLPGDDRIIGTVSLNGIIYGPFRSCFLGYRMARCETCHGYMTEAVREVCLLAFNRYRLHRIEANVMPANHASARLVENLGFVNEGYSGHYLQIAGVWEGHDHYVLLNHDLEPPLA